MEELTYNFKPNNFINPLVKKFPITSPFGWRTIFGGRSFHNGVDLGCPAGTPIQAIAGGEILDVWNNDAGLCMRVQHDCGLITGYAHLSETLKKAGERVEQGDIIAKTGNSGKWTTGAHLHFTCYENENFQDPQKYFNF